MSKFDLMEEEANPNYSSEQEEQLELKKQFEAKEKAKTIQEAVKLLQDNGFIVTIK